MAAGLLAKLVVQPLQRRLCVTLGPERLLWVWYNSLRNKPPSAKDIHTFPTPVTTDATRRTGTWFLLHAPSCQHAAVSPLIADLVRLSAADEIQAGELVPTTANKYSAEDLQTGFQAYTAITQHLDQVSTPPPPATELPPRKGELLMFGNLTCNMACPYCLSRDARDQATAGRAPKLMPLETAHRSIRFIAERMAGKVESVCINFTLGGEPLLSMERYQHLRDYCTCVAEEFGITITLNMNTNGTAFSDAFLKYAEENGVWMAVSLDGPKEIHDSMRPFLSGKGTYDTIVESLPRVLNSSCPGLNDAAGGAVLTARNPYPKRVYQHLIGLGFRHVVVTPVRDEPHLEWSLSAETVQAFKRGYTEYAEWVLECLANEDDRIYVALIEHDFFGRFLIRVIRGTKQPYRCEAARTTFGVGIDGGLYPCDNFIKLDEFRLGDVFNGLDPERHAAFLKDTMIDEKPVCKDCWARYQCGGGCYFTSALANGDHRVPHAAKCDLIRHCVELSIWILLELRGRNPKALERLYRSVLEAQSLQVTPAVDG